MAGISVVDERVTFDAVNGPIDAYLARPTDWSGGPAILVVHELFGLVDHIEELTRRLAREGYLALAPDLFSHDAARKAVTVANIEDAATSALMSGKGVEGLADLPVERQQGARLAFDWVQTIFPRMATFAPDLEAATSYLRSRDDVTKIGAVGWCFGGGLVGQLLVRAADIDAGVIYYGQIPSLDEVGNVRVPAMGHYGGEDTMLTAGVPAFEKAMTKAGKDFVAFVYEGAPHAFNNDERSSYRPDAAQLSWGRTLGFFGEQLASS